MSTPIKAAAPRGRKPVRPKLTEYESKQIEDIAAWKSVPPNPLDEITKKIMHPVGHWLGKLIPDAPAKALFDRAYALSQRLAGQEDILRQAGVKDLAALRKKPLEECDQRAAKVSGTANLIAAVEGLATGAGGFLTTFLDVPILFVLTLRTIMRIGHCYGYPLDSKRGQAFVLGVYLTATSGTLHTKYRRLEELRELEELLISETQKEILSEELLSFVFQLEVFDFVPGIGAISGAVLNIGVMRRVERTARRVFQERWLRDNGKVHAIVPAPPHERAIAHGWAGALGRAAYAGGYGIGFAAALPASIVSSLFVPFNNSLAQGARAGATAAAVAAEKMLEPAPRKITAARRPGRSRGALVPAV
jgi:hypothetical protein